MCSFEHPLVIIILAIPMNEVIIVLSFMHAYQWIVLKLPVPSKQILQYAINSATTSASANFTLS